MYLRQWCNRLTQVRSVVIQIVRVTQVRTLLPKGAKLILHFSVAEFSGIMLKDYVYGLFFRRIKW